MPAVPRITAQTPNDLKARFLREAPGKWAEYRTVAAHLQGEYTLTIVTTQPRPSTTARTDTFKQGTGCALFVWGRTKVIEGNLNSAGERLWGENSKYSFELAPKAPGAGWVVAGLEIGNTKPLRIGTPVTDAVLEAVTPQFRGGLPKSLAEVSQEKGFVMHKVAWAETGEKRYVRVEYEYRYMLPGDTDMRSISGWALLDPEQYWHATEIFETKKTKGYSGSYQTKYEFRNSADGRPIIRRSVSVVDGKDEKGKEHKRTATVEWKCREDASVAESQCKLSAFGLAEPLEFVDEPRPNYFVWLLGCAVFLFGLAALFGYLRRRGIVRTVS